MFSSADAAKRRPCAHARAPPVSRR